MVVWESVPTRVSGWYKSSSWITRGPGNSRFTWCTMPMPGGTTRKVSKACMPPAQMKR